MTQQLVGAAFASLAFAHTDLLGGGQHGCVKQVILMQVCEF